MVKTELMIGDWYKWYADGKYYYYQVVSPTFQLDDSTISNFEPISLTKEILLENGFKVKDNKYTLQKFYGDGVVSFVKVHQFQHWLRDCNIHIDFAIKDDEQH